MISIQIQKMIHVGKPVGVRRMAIGVLGTKSSHLMANLIQKLQKTVEMLSREIMTS